MEPRVRVRKKVKVTMSGKDPHPRSVQHLRPDPLLRKGSPSKGRKTWSRGRSGVDDGRVRESCRNSSRSNESDQGVGVEVVCVLVRVCVCVCYVCGRTYTYVRVYVRVWTCVHMCTCVCGCTHVCACVGSGGEGPGGGNTGERGPLGLVSGRVSCTEGVWTRIRVRLIFRQCT